MFDDKNNIESDLLMRSILSQAEEEVPSHVWDNISSELDRIAVQKTIKPAVIWFRRSAIAVAAAAAITVGVVFNWGKEDTEFIPKAIGTDLIAVAEASEPGQTEQISSPVQTEPARIAKVSVSSLLPATETKPAPEVKPVTESTPEATAGESTIQEQIEEKSTQKYIADAGSIVDDWTDEFDEEKIGRNKRKASL